MRCVSAAAAGAAGDALTTKHCWSLPFFLTSIDRLPSIAKQSSDQGFRQARETSAGMGKQHARLWPASVGNTKKLIGSDLAGVEQVIGQRGVDARSLADQEGVAMTDRDYLVSTVLRIMYIFSPWILLVMMCCMREPFA